jgi:hypothetical protein
MLHVRGKIIETHQKALLGTGEWPSVLFLQKGAVSLVRLKWGRECWPGGGLELALAA